MSLPGLKRFQFLFQVSMKVGILFITPHPEGFYFFFYSESQLSSKY